MIGKLHLVVRQTRGQRPTIQKPNLLYLEDISPQLRLTYMDLSIPHAHFPGRGMCFHHIRGYEDLMYNLRS